MGIIPEHKAKVKPGQEFGRWTVLGMPFTTEKRRYLSLVVCECQCGTIRVVFQNGLLSGMNTSCGCWNVDSHTTHGMSRSRIYKTWEGMNARCTRPTDTRYKDYGGRGITVCSEWADSFETFHRWAVSNGYKETLTIERKNVNGNYEPDNCCWETRKRQARNRRNTQFLTAFGETKSLSDWIEDKRCQVITVTLKKRVKSGWGHEKAISTPPAVSQKTRTVPT